MALEMGAPEFAKRLLRDDVLVLDVRPAAHYYREHIRGAISAPAVPAMLRASDSTTALSAIEADDGFDAASRHSLQLAMQRLLLCELVVVYDSGGPSGDGPAFHLAKLLTNDGAAAEVSVLQGGYTAFARLEQHASLRVRPPSSVGSRTGSLDLTPKGIDSADPATCCLELDGGRFRLWIGGARDAGNRPFLVHNAVSHILNCTKELPNRYAADDELDLHYLKLGLRDECEEDLASRLDSCVAFLAAARAHALERTQSSCDGLPADALPRSCSVLVHCYMGRSRSVAASVAYMVSGRRSCRVADAQPQPHTDPPRRISYPA